MGLLYLVVQYIENRDDAQRHVSGHPRWNPSPPGSRGSAGRARSMRTTGVLSTATSSPSNVLMPSPSWPQLADFGIAKLLNLSGSQNLTMTGVFHGHRRLLSRPNRPWARRLMREETSILGVLLYETLTGGYRTTPTTRSPSP